jgi:hypothetical protein
LGKAVVLVLSVLHLVNIPFGTALGIYSLWASSIRIRKRRLRSKSATVA